MSARQRTSLRACASVCGRRTSTLIPKTDPPSPPCFLSHTHTNHTRGWNITHTPEGPESVRKKGHRAVQITQLPALLPGGGRAMGKERRGASTTALAHAHCNDCTMPRFKLNGLQCRAGAAAIGHLRGMAGAGTTWQPHMVGAVATGHRAPAATGRQRKDGAGARMA